jgi:molybdopterin converting factor small subunit
MTEDHENYHCLPAYADIPTFEKAVKRREKHIAKLKKQGDHDRAERIANCRKGNRCYLNDCAVCDRRYQIALSRLPKSAIFDLLEGPGDLHFSMVEVAVDAIKIVGPRRPIDQKKLAALKASIKEIDLQTPITVQVQKNGQIVLVTGWYRLVAMKELGKRAIPCFHYHEGGIDTYLWKRAENVYRAELRVLERAEAINEMRQAILQKGGQVAPPGGSQPNNAGIKKAAKALGFTKEEVRRSKVIAEMISPEAKAEAKKLGLDDNQHALLDIAKLPANAQCAAISAIADGKLAARARLASRAVAVASEKATAKIQAIEAKMAKKNDTLHTLKKELAGERERLDEVHADLVATYVNNALISGAATQLADEDGIQAASDEPPSPEDEASFAAVVEAWNKARELKAKLANASPMVLERYLAMVRSWGAQQHTKSEDSEESDS